MVRVAMAVNDLIAANTLLTLSRKSDLAEASNALSLLDHGMKKPIQAMRRSKGLGQTRLSFADAVVDREVFQVIWGVDPKSAPDLRIAVDQHLAWCEKRAVAFKEFGFELCWRYFQNHAGV